MKQPSRSLIIGRFQPFHLGHLWLVKKALMQSEELIVAIGSAEDNFLKSNPLTAGERMEIILGVLEENRVDRSKFLLVPIRNINNYALWTHHVENLLPKFEAVFTGSSTVKALFEKAGKHPVFFYPEDQKEIKVSATQIRKKILENDPSWKEMLSASSVLFLEEIDIYSRLQVCE